MKKVLTFMVSAVLLTVVMIGCKSEEDAVATPQVTKVTIIDPVGYAQNMGAWIPGTDGGRKTLMLEEGQNYMLSVICEPSGQSPAVTWNITNSQFEEATVNAQGIISGVKEDPNNTNECLITVTAAPNVTDVIEIKVLKELSGVYEIKVANRDITIPDGGSVRSTVNVTSASNASGSLYNKDLITGFFSDKNRSNFNDAVTVSFIAGSSFDIQANGPGCNIMLAYSKAYLNPTNGTKKTFEDVRDYAVLAVNNQRQMLQVDSAYVSLDKHNVHLAKGETAQLTAKLVCANPGKPSTITFVSSHPEVATVDQTGKITAVASGLATITAYTNHLAEAHECVVNVDNAIPVAVTRITGQQDFTNAHTVTRSLLIEGQTLQLYSDSHKDETNAASGTKWHSSDPNIITVDDNGLVKAVGRGTAAVYATPYVDVNGQQAMGISDCGAVTVMPDYAKAKVGDIFYSDGSFSTALESGKTPIGIIAYLNRDPSTNATIGVTGITELAETSRCQFPNNDNYMHGLVMSLTNANTANVIWSKNATAANLTGGITSATDDATLKPSITSTNLSGFNACLYTNELTSPGTTSLNFVPAVDYPACYVAWHYNVAVPSYVTNWFMPTAPQWYAILYNGLGDLKTENISPAWNTYFNNSNAFTKINNALKKVSDGGTKVDQLPANCLLWTSNEGDTEGKTAAALQVDTNGLKFTSVSKTADKGEGNAPTVVRTFFAF